MAYGELNGHTTDDVDMFGAQYFENGWTYRLGYSGTSIENGTWGIKWSRDRRHHYVMTLCWLSIYIWMQISEKLLKIEAQFQWTTNSKCHMANGIVT